MNYTEQPTPPFNSPYQTHASRSDSMLEAAYPSPGRHDSMTSGPHGLGLYNYHHQVHTTLPPSPSPSDCWSNHVSSCASPLMTQAIADPYASGAFEHPIIRSPQPWDGAQMSPRSSVSSTTVLPVYSHAAHDSSYHNLNHGINSVGLENHGWPHDARFAHSGPTLPSSRPHPLTVAPERLSSTVLSYEPSYTASRVGTLGSVPPSEYSNHTDTSRSYGQSSASPTSFPQASTHPVRRQRAKRESTKINDAAFICVPCKKGFARSYNYKQHLETHNVNRKKPHVCRYMDCQRPFVRKTDLDRHVKSVHSKTKDQLCSRCNAVFARKDTRDR